MLREVLETVRQEARELAAEVPFEAYAARAVADRRLTRRSHALINDMIRAAGVDTAPDGGPRYDLFRGELFGLDGPIRQVADYFAAAARGLDPRRRILLLVGPPGSGKSTLVDVLKRGLERYTRTLEGEVWAIKGCPVHEEPLHLIPVRHRESLEGLDVEGDLCPFCRWLVREVYRGDLARVPVERVVFSAAEGVGIGTFVATDPGSEDLTRLVGRVDVSLLEPGSVVSARRAFRLDGELQAANRGLADLVEVLKMDERFLSVLLTATEERLIKLGGPGLMYADEAIVAESNLAEYEALADDPKAAALRDRLVVVKVGYALSVEDEVRIYEKMLRHADLGATHLSPVALPAAATLAVLSRLSGADRPGRDMSRKLRLYDGRFVSDSYPGEPEALREASPDEGMSGLSPRFVATQLSNALAAQPPCLSGIDLLRALWSGLSQRAGFREEDRDGWLRLFSLAREEHDDLVRRAIRIALVRGFNSEAEAKAREGLRELELWTGGAGEGDLGTLRAVEQTIAVPGYHRAEVRLDWLSRLRSSAEYGDVPLHMAEGGLREAIERLSLPDWPRASSRLTVDRGAILEGLVDEGGFRDDCAVDLIDYARQLVRPRRERRGERASGWLTG